MVNNKEVQEKTCQKDCVFFDAISYKCSYYDQEVLDNDPRAQHCPHFNDKMLYLNDDDSLYESYDLESDWTDDNLTIDLSTVDYGNYPEQPPGDAPRSDSNWFINPDKTFGCWVVHHPKNRLRLMYNKKINTNNRRYYSPIPLHDHNSSASLRQYVVWYVDENGFGSYELLRDGEIVKL